MKNIIVILVLSLFSNLLTAQRPKGTTPTSSTDTKTRTSTRSNKEAAPAPQRKTGTPASTERATSSPSRTSTRGSGSEPRTAAPKLNPTSSSRTSSATDNTPANNRGASTTPATTAANTKTGLQPATAAAATVAATTTAASTSEAAKPNNKVNWMTLQEAVEKSKTEKRKIFVDVYTDWCGWCKRMDETTFSDPRVVKYLNENFYPVKFNAEQQQDINFKDKTYHFKKVGKGGYHELAAEWLNNRLSYPTVVFLDENLDLIQPLPNYVEAPRFETIITYFGTNSYKRTPWETYEKNFVSNRN